MTESAGRPKSVPDPIGVPPSNKNVAINIPRASIGGGGPLKTPTTALRSQLAVASPSPVTVNGSFEFDRVIKSGYAQRRTQKTKTWKPVYLVLRPNALSIYKSDNESKLRYKIYLSDLSAVTLLKDPKQKRHNLFGLFSPSRNWHFEAPTPKDAQEWVDLIRQDARIEEEEEELFLASPIVRRQSFAPAGVLGRMSLKNKTPRYPPIDGERLASSSPEPVEPTSKRPNPENGRRQSHVAESSGMSGNEFTYSDFSDTDVQRNKGITIESLAAKSQAAPPPQGRTSQGNKNTSQGSGLNNTPAAEQQDPDRVVWQGWLRLLRRSKGGMRVRHWKNCWAVLRPRNLIFYKDESEYAALFIIDVETVVNVVDVDPPGGLGRSKAKDNDKAHSLQVITDEKSYRLRAPDEEALLVFLGAFKSLLAKRREFEARASIGSGAGVGTVVGTGAGVGAGAGS